jgi:hypothetical protein
MWTLYNRRAGEIKISPDPFVFSASLEQHTFFSSVNRTCVLWCVENSNVCLGANILDSDTWAASAVSGQWRLMDGGRLTLLTSVSKEVEIQGPAWFKDLCSSLSCSSLSCTSLSCTSLSCTSLSCTSLSCPSLTLVN